VRKTTSKTFKRLSTYLDLSRHLASPIQADYLDDGGATHLSDTFMSGIFTPYSTFSGISRLTGVSTNVRRKGKELRKAQNRYNLRPSVRTDRF